MDSLIPDVALYLANAFLDDDDALRWARCSFASLTTLRRYAIKRALRPESNAMQLPPIPPSVDEALTGLSSDIEQCLAAMVQWLGLFRRGSPRMPRDMLLDIVTAVPRSALLWLLPLRHYCMLCAASNLAAACTHMQTSSTRSVANNGVVQQVCTLLTCG
jgi:hypothetical protein